MGQLDVARLGIADDVNVVDVGFSCRISSDTALDLEIKAFFDKSLHGRPSPGRNQNFFGADFAFLAILITVEDLLSLRRFFDLFHCSI